VTIVAPGAASATGELPQCTGDPLAQALSGGGVGVESPPAAEARSTVPPAPPARITREDFPDSASPPFPALPGLHLFDEPELPLALGLAVLGLLVVSLLGIFVEVIRHLRSSHV